MKVETTGRGELMRPYTIKPTNGEIRPIGKICNSLGIKLLELDRDDEWLKGAVGRSYYIKDQKRIETIDGRNIDKYIVISTDLSDEEKRLTATHELAHFILGHLLAGEDEQYNVSFPQQEFEAEALGFILYNFLYGIDGGRKAK